MGENISQNIQTAESTPTFQFRKVSRPFCLFIIYLFYLFIYLSIDLFIYYFYFHYNYYLLYVLLLSLLIPLLLSLLLLLLLVCYIFCLMYASKVRAACIIVPYNDGSKSPIRLSARRRSCVAFGRSRMFGLDIAPKEKLSCQFNPVSIQE